MKKGLKHIKLSIPNKTTSSIVPHRRGIGPMGGGPPGMVRGTEKANDFKGTMKGLVSYLKPYWTKIIIVILLAVLSTVFAILSPKLLGNMTDQLVTDIVNQRVYDQILGSLPAGINVSDGTTGEDLLQEMSPETIDKIPTERIEQIKLLDLTHRPEISWGALANISYILLGLYIFSAGFNYIQGWIMTDVTQQVTYKMRQDISKKINRLPLRYFDTRTFGEVLSRVTNDVDTISSTLNQSLTQIITSVVTIVGILIMMTLINWQMTLVALIALPVSFAIIAFVVKNSQKYFKTQQKSLGKLNGYIEEVYTGHTIIKAFNREKTSLKAFSKINDRLYLSAWKSQFLSSLMRPIMNFVKNLDYVGVVIVGSHLAIKGIVTVGNIQSFIQYVQQLSRPVVQTANISNILQSTAAAAERIFEFLLEAEETTNVPNTIHIKNIKGNVEFDHVWFGYEPHKKIIKDLSVTIEAGQRIAIVGPTGAGKTTIVNLLMRFYDIDKGSIRIDGFNIRRLPRAELRKLFGMVLQDTWLFNGTIKENLAYGNIKATDSEIKDVAKATHIDHFIRSLADGYDTIINEDADNISQGEKQLFTIARAMLANPSMLILDEATSNVDTRTEILIQRAMEKLMSNRTSFIIAHRLSTIRDADLILVINDGKLIEKGKHQDLLAQKGFYTDLYNSQFSKSGSTK